MQTINSAIVTLTCEELKFKTDMELPVFLEIEQLEANLLEALRILSPTLFFRVSRMSLVFNGNILASCESLASAGVWDGAILKLKTEQST